jgi:hypothetical protein
MTSAQNPRARFLIQFILKFHTVDQLRLHDVLVAKPEQPYAK